METAPRHGAAQAFHDGGGMMLIGQPPEKKADPQNVVDGQFSGPS